MELKFYLNYDDPKIKMIDQNCRSFIFILKERNFFKVIILFENVKFLKYFIKCLNFFFVIKYDAIIIIQLILNSKYYYQKLEYMIKKEIKLNKNIYFRQLKAP